jgi:hypothetical protein
MPSGNMPNYLTSTTTGASAKCPKVTTEPLALIIGLAGSVQKVFTNENTVL